MNKYLTFKVYGQSCGIPVSMVQEILLRKDITPLPKGSSFVKGVIHFRGAILPVLDLRERLQLPTRTPGAVSKPCIIVIRPADQHRFPPCAWLVDDIEEVIICQDDQIKTPDGISLGNAGDLLDGMIAKEDKIILILKAESVLMSGDVGKEAEGEAFSP